MYILNFCGDADVLLYLEWCQPFQEVLSATAANFGMKEKKNESAGTSLLHPSRPDIASARRTPKLDL